MMLHPLCLIECFITGARVRQAATYARVSSRSTMIASRYRRQVQLPARPIIRHSFLAMSTTTLCKQTHCILTTSMIYCMCQETLSQRKECIRYVMVVSLYRTETVQRGRWSVFGSTILRSIKQTLNRLNVRTAVVTPSAVSHQTYSCAKMTPHYVCCKSPTRIRDSPDALTPCECNRPLDA